MIQVRHSLTTRFLLTCISSYFFDGGNTLDDLHQFILDDAEELYRTGVTVFKRGINMILFLFFEWVNWKKCYPSLSSFSVPNNFMETQVQSHNFRLVCIGTKGGWVYLRKATRFPLQVTCLVLSRKIYGNFPSILHIKL